MENNVTVAAFEAFVFFLVEKSETHLPIPRGNDRKYQKPHPKKKHKSKTLFRMCMIFLKITCLQVIIINSDYLPPPFLFPFSLFSGNLHSKRMWQLNLRHFQWQLNTALSMKGIQGIDDELGNEIFEILEEHVSCLTWHPLFFAHPFFSHRFCCCFCLSLKKVMLNMTWPLLCFHV